MNSSTMRLALSPRVICVPPTKFDCRRARVHVIDIREATLARHASGPGLAGQ